MTREDAIEILKDAESRVFHAKLNNALKIAIEALKEERPHGKWLETDNRWGVGTWECSACTMYTIQRFSFCPHCGASMEVSHDRE